MDEILFKKYRDGDREAFARLYETHANRALRLARVITRDDQTAADAVQEAFIRAYIYRQKLRAGESFELWFTKIVVNESRRQLQKSSKLVPMPDVADANAAHQPVYAFLEYQPLYTAIEQLSDILRTAVALKYVNGLSEREMAQVLKTSVNTVKSRLFQARQKLKHLIRDSKE